MRRLLLMLTLVSIALAPLALTPRPSPVTAAEAEPIHLTSITELPAINEIEPNNRILPPGTNAQPIAVGRTDSWRQPISGAVSSSSDIDYFAFTIDAPGSLITIDLTNLGADYDLVFGGGVDPVTGVGGATETFEFDNGERGLEDVTQIGGQITSIGGQITSIGGQITSIGGQITSIGGQITSIGGQITSIGGQITSISINPGTRDERIETIVWQPGLYFVAVAPSSAGQISPLPYRLVVTLQRSTLQSLGPAPHVEFYTDRPDPAVTTLYIINSARMEEVYPSDLTSINIITTTLQQSYSLTQTLVMGLNEQPLIQEKGAVIDLANLEVITGSEATPFSQLLTEWSQPANQRNPLYANYIASIIDHVIEAAIDPTGNGSSSNVRVEYLIRANNDSNLGNETNPVTPYPNVRNIVLVGSDEIIPFFRLPDLTTIANEADYLEYLKTIDARSNGASLISPDNPLGAALRNRMMVSDDPYGADRPYRFYGFPLFVPRLAVGRLVEQPAEIADFLRRNRPVWYEDNILLAGQEYNPSSASITGYDFLIDGANAITRTLTQATSISVTKRTVITNTWSRSDFENNWLEQPLNATGFFTTPLAVFSRTNTLLSSLNAHFDHWQLIPAVERGSDPHFPADRILSTGYEEFIEMCDVYPIGCPGFFYNTIYYSVGCHSGYNVPFNAINQTLDLPIGYYAADFAQAFNRHAGNWIGNTGYGYGTLDGVDYSERLAALLTQELVRNETRPDPMAENGVTYVGRSIGEALVNAKLRYLRTSIGLNTYDYKVLAITTLYGLPWKRILVDNPLTAPVEDLNAELPAGDRTAPAPIAGSQLTRTITFTINYDTNYLQPTRTGSVVQLNPSNFTISDTFLLASTFNVTPTVTVFNNNLIGMPSLPAFTYDITALSGSDDASPLVVRDVIFLGGQYNTVENFNPTVTQIVTETATPLITTTIEPDFSAGIGVWVPDRFFGHSSIGSGADQRDTLISTAAQFRATNGVTGTLRTYTRLVYQVIYTDPAADGADDALEDQNPPVIERVRIAGQDAGLQSISTPIEVIVSDPDHPANPQVNVTGVYLAADNVTWTPLTFTKDAENPRLWMASVPRNWPDVRIIITAIDNAGNTAMYTAKGAFAPPTYRVLVPVIAK
ncbi:peptidase [Chloroflexus islandicus]|uniref:peptidase n=1 Tax=Chloroflexus islandicus TaxID=1707952 RepID=UPI000A7F2B9B|nr:peptidase [Chloroflexus islandicus]